MHGTAHSGARSRTETMDGKSIFVHAVSLGCVAHSLGAGSVYSRAARTPVLCHKSSPKSSFSSRSLSRFHQCRLGAALAGTLLSQLASLSCSHKMFYWRWWVDFMGWVHLAADGVDAGDRGEPVVDPSFADPQVVPLEARILYLFVFCVVLLNMASTGRCSPYLPLLGSALLAAGIGHQEMYLSISAGDFWAHALPGFMAKELGCALLRSRNDGGPMVTRTPIVPALGAVGFIALFVGQVLKLGLHRWVAQVHGAIYVFGALLMGSVAVGSWSVRREGAKACADSVQDEIEMMLPLNNGGNARTAAPRTAHPGWRYLHDPVLVMAFGLLFIAHRHDVERLHIRNVHHAVTGLICFAVAFAMLFSFAAHRASGGPGTAVHESGVARAARVAHGYCWMLLGWWTLLMSFLFYVFKGRIGLWDMGYAPNAGQGHEWEETLTYLSVVAYLLACRTACMIPSSEPEEQRAGCAGMMSPCCGAARPATRMRQFGGLPKARISGSLISPVPSPPASPPPALGSRLLSPSPLDLFDLDATPRRSYTTTLRRTSLSADGVLRSDMSAPRSVASLRSRVLWSLLVFVCAAVAVLAILILTVDNFHKEDRILSISEMLVNSPPSERAEVTVAIMLAVLGTLIAFVANYRGPPPGAGASYACLAVLQYASFCVAIAAVQVVVAITFRELLVLHFTAAIIFFFGAAVSLTLDAYLECKLGAHEASNASPCRTAFRAYIKVMTAALMWLALVLGLVIAPLTDPSEQFDRRPAFVVGEFVGVGGFVLHSLALMPLLG